MSLRQLQIVLPVDRQEALDEILEDACPSKQWTVETEAGFLVTCVVIRMEMVEPVTDAILETYGEIEGFRLSILSIEATYPKLPEPEEEEDPDLQEEKRWTPRFGRVSREELVEDIEGSSKTTPVSMIMVSLATIVASVGLIKNSPAIIIGAMVIAPLLGPNIALALGTTLGDTSMAKRAMRSNIVGVLLSLVISALAGLMISGGEMTGEMQARTMVDFGDVLLALASGAAGAVAFTSGAPQVVVGVMVAVALLPPTSVCGMMLGQGEWSDAGDAALLTLTNITCINLSATGVFLIQGVRPNSWAEKDRARSASLRAMLMWGLMLAALAAVIMFVEIGSP